MSDTTELRRLAEAATPGPWVTEQATSNLVPVYVSSSTTCEAVCMMDGGDMPQRHKDAAYIAAMHPETTLALLDELAELRSAVITFCAPWAVLSAQRMGLPPNHIYAQHYDLLAKCGARMVDFVRHDNER